MSDNTIVLKIKNKQEYNVKYLLNELNKIKYKMSTDISFNNKYIIKQIDDFKHFYINIDDNNYLIKIAHQFNLMYDPYVNILEIILYKKDN